MPHVISVFPGEAYTRVANENFACLELALPEQSAVLELAALVKERVRSEVGLGGIVHGGMSSRMASLLLSD